MRRAPTYLIVIAAMALSPSQPAIGADVGRLLDVRKVWDGAPHNAFTDLVRFNDEFYLAFREGSTHTVPPVGQPGGNLRILRSDDGLAWSSAGVITGGVDRDLRDAKLVVTADNRLLLEGARAPHAAPAQRQSMVWFSDDGTTWSDSTDIGDPNYWLWGVHRNGDQIYSIGYGPTTSSSTGWTTRLYRSGDGVDFQALVPTLTSQSGSSEASLLFREDGSAVALVRRDAGSQLAVVGTSQGDFTEWNWTNANVRFGGPEMIALPDGRIVAGGRRYDGGQRTSLNFLNPTTGVLTEFLALPSAGDSSYPGMVWHDDRLWVSYYSSHEGRTSIYMAQVEFVDEQEIAPIRHTGDAHPQSESWIALLGGVGIAANGPVNDNGTRAWAIHDNLATAGSREAWTRMLTMPEAASAATEGWRMKASIRVVGVSDTPDGGIELSVFPSSDIGYTLWLGADAAGNAILSEFKGKLSTGLALGRSATLAGGGYHDYEMAFDPATQTINVYADGALVIENLLPVDREGQALNRILWGSNASSGKGNALYSYVEFVMGAAVAGDFNTDGSVDGADFLYWQQTLGSEVFPGSSADADRSGTIDADDLAAWKVGFTTLANAAVVPEPLPSIFVLQLLLALPPRVQIAFLGSLVRP